MDSVVDLQDEVTLEWATVYGDVRSFVSKSYIGHSAGLYGKSAIKLIELSDACLFGYRMCSRGFSLAFWFHYTGEGKRSVKYAPNTDVENSNDCWRTNF